MNNKIINEVPCPHCRGHGEYESKRSIDRHGNHIKCEICNGEKTVTVSQQRAYQKRVAADINAFMIDPTGKRNAR